MMSIFPIQPIESMVEIFSFFSNGSSHKRFGELRDEHLRFDLFALNRC